MSERVICTIKSPMNGEITRLEDIPDPAFARKMIGDGTAILPDEDGGLYSPADGTILSVFQTRHAIVLETPEGVKVLLHVGIDSMKLQGKGFEAHVESGQDVKLGDRMLTINLDYIKQNTESTLSPVILTDLKPNQTIKVVAEGHVSAGDDIIQVIEED